MLRATLLPDRHVRLGPTQLQMPEVSWLCVGCSDGDGTACLQAQAAVLMWPSQSCCAGHKIGKLAGCKQAESQTSRALACQTISRQPLAGTSGVLGISEIQTSRLSSRGISS